MTQILKSRVQGPFPIKVEQFFNNIYDMYHEKCLPSCFNMWQQESQDLLVFVWLDGLGCLATCRLPLVPGFHKCIPDVLPFFGRLGP